MSPREAERLGLDELTELAGGCLLPCWTPIRGSCCISPASASLRRRYTAGAQALNRALATLGEPPSDPELAREVRAELARDLVRDDNPEAAEALATAVLGRRLPPRNGPGPGCLRRWGAPPPGIRTTSTWR